MASPPVLASSESPPDTYSHALVPTARLVAVGDTYAASRARCRSAARQSWTGWGTRRRSGAEPTVAGTH